MIENREINLDYNEIYRYLGAKGRVDDPDIAQLVDSCAKEMLATIRPRYTYGVYEVSSVDNGVQINDSSIVFQGSSIKKHLKDAKKIAIMAVTLGIETETLIRRYSSQSITKTVILDSVATETIEKVCDLAQYEIIAKENTSNYYTNFRFSPGYGDLPIEVQPDIINLLDTYKKIGLSVNENYILIPRKSVTAIFGFFEHVKGKQKSTSCDICNLKEHCAKRKEGFYCGNSR